MNRPELIDALRRLAEEARGSTDLLPAAGILFSVCGALAEGSEMGLFGVTVEFSRKQAERLTGEVDWSDDTIEVGRRA